MLSTATGFPESSAKQFVIELAEALSSSLAKGNEVKIKGLGTFVPSDDEMVGVVFIPDEEMAREVNAPFDMFEAVYLDEDVTDDIINEPLDNIAETQPTSEP
ncbi:MAG: HU family DNA-binding protein, partial [Muribaculaceae bacterium]|nr:HU family DNA-binding protein [Muribaculaceae bacterium]